MQDHRHGLAAHIQHEFRKRALPKAYPHTQDRSDRELLLREAGAINASVDWDRSGMALTISVTAPKGFVWASTKERTLQQTTERVDGHWIRESVADTLESMAQGFIGQARAKHDDDCECSRCEDAQDDLEELDFG